MSCQIQRKLAFSGGGNLTKKGGSASGAGRYPAEWAVSFIALGYMYDVEHVDNQQFIGNHHSCQGYNIVMETWIVGMQQPAATTCIDHNVRNRPYEETY